MSFPRDGSLPSYFYLLEESRKSWHHFITDKFIHVVEVLAADDNPFAVASELNIYAHPWLEINVWLGGGRKSHNVFRHTALVEHINFRLQGEGESRQIDIPDGGIERNMSVLVDIPQLVKSPQIGALIGVPTIVRLQRFDDDHRGIRNAVSLPSNPHLSINRVLAKHGKGNLAARGLPTHRGKLERKIVQRRPQTANEFSGNDGAIKGRFAFGSDCDNVFSTFGVILGRKHIGLFFREFGNFDIERIEVRLRPFQLSLDVRNLGHRGMLGRSKRDVKG